MVVIDDFDKVLINDESNSVINFIAANTKFDSLSYLFTIQDTRLDLISNHKDMWLRYCYENNSYYEKARRRHAYDYYRISHMAGWINLADFNLIHEIGYKILKKANHHEMVGLLKAQNNQPSPLEAQILLYLIEHDEDIGAIGSFNFFEFRDEFWKKLMENIKDAILRERIKKAVPYIARSVMSTSRLDPPLGIVIDSLKDNDPAETIRLLQKTSLLGINEDAETGELGAAIWLNYLFVWNKFLPSKFGVILKWMITHLISKRLLRG